VNGLTSEFWHKGKMLKRLRVAFHPAFQLSDEVTIDGKEYFVIAVQWTLSAIKTETTLGADGALLQRLELGMRDRYGVRE
jgi:hypothetical protein